MWAGCAATRPSSSRAEAGAGDRVGVAFGVGGEEGLCFFLLSPIKPKNGEQQEIEATHSEKVLLRTPSLEHSNHFAERSENKNQKA